MPCGAFWAGQETEKEKEKETVMGKGITAGLGGTAKVRYEKTGTARLATNFPKVSYNFSAIVSKVTYKKSVLQSKVTYKKSNLTKHNDKIKIQISISITRCGSHETTQP
jgi:hypothetical protein